MTVESFVEFNSRIDRWIKAIVWGTCVLLLGACYVVQADTSSGPVANGLIFLITLIAVPFLLWSIHGTRYRLTDTQLLVRSGPFRRNIPLGEITSIEPIRSLQSGPALSRDRFLIRYESFATVMVSPNDRAGFLQEIAQRASHLAWDEGKLAAVS